MDELFIQRSFDLARLGGAKVSPNPMVGAVIVAENRIIGEGFHKAYGEPHAEVNAVNSVKQQDRHLLPQSTIYISLEPCCIHGKTPPCTNLILDQKIPRVVISAIDRSPEVNGKSLKILNEAGISVTQDVLPAVGIQLSQPRTTYVCRKRPYVILKYARSKDGFMAKNNGEQVWISNDFTNRLTHKWRGEINAIMVGTRTALLDNPSLTNRLYYGKNPVRVVLDKDLLLDKKLKIFDHQAKTIVFNEKENLELDNIYRVKIAFDQQLIHNLLTVLAQHKIGTLMVEGGATLLDSFYHDNLWDEARVITSANYLVNGLKAPMPGKVPSQSFQLESDEISVYLNDLGC